MAACIKVQLVLYEKEFAEGFWCLLAKAQVVRVSMVCLVVPGFKYLGPGNKLPREELLVADFVALEHDRVYETASHRWTIACADLRAAMLLLWVSFWAGLSSVCLLVKFTLERCCGITFYPFRFLNKMEFVIVVLLMCTLLWLAVIEMRLSGWRNRDAINECVRATTLESLECLLTRNN